MFLSPADLVELTDYTRPTKQAEWLRKEGFCFKVGADGKVKLLEAEVMRMMSHFKGNHSTGKTVQPDFSRV